jgi:hypothetical protein
MNALLKNILLILLAAFGTASCGFLSGPKAYIETEWEKFQKNFETSWGLKKGTPPNQNAGDGKGEREE